MRNRESESELESKEIAVSNITEVSGMSRNERNKRNGDRELNHSKSPKISQSQKSKSKSKKTINESERSGFLEKSKKSNVSLTSNTSELTQTNIHIQKSELNMDQSEYSNPVRALERFIVTPSDRVVKPIIGNTDIEKIEGYDYKEEVGGLKLLKNSEISKLDKDEFEEYLINIYKILVDEASSMKDKLQIFNYFTNFIQNSDNANAIIESYFMDLFLKYIKSAKTKQFKISLSTIIGLLIRYTTNVNYELAQMDIVPLMINLMKDKTSSVKRRAVAVLGEYLFFGST